MKPTLTVVPAGLKQLAETERQIAETKIAAVRMRHLAPPGETFKVARAAKLTDRPISKPAYTAEQRTRFDALFLKILAIGIGSAGDHTGK